MIQRALHGHLWEIHSPTRFRLVGRDVWLTRSGEGWRLARADGSGSVPILPSRYEAMEYIRIAFESYGDSVA